MLREKELILLENLKKDNEKKTEEIRQLRNNQLIGQVSGEETATITDGALAFANILEETEIEVEGEKRKAYVVKLPQGLSKQKLRQGYNFLDFKKWINSGLSVVNAILNSKTETEITITTTENDSFIDTLSDSSTPSYNQERVEKYGTEVNETQYSLSCLKNNTSNSRLIVTFFDENYNYLGIRESQSTNLRHIYNFDILENTKYITYRFGLLNNNIGTQVKFSEMMLLEGSYTTENLPKYEEYGTSPSIDFPSEITNFSVNPNNLYNPENNTSGWLDESGAIHSSVSSQVTDFIEIDENKFYFIKFNKNSLSAKTERIYNIYNASKTVLKSLKYNPIKDTKISIPRIKNAKYLRATFDIEMTDIVIEEEKRLISTNKNILPIAYNKGQHIDSTTGIDIDFISKNRIKLNGTTTSNLNLNIINGNVFKWKKGKTYCLQLKIIEGSYSGQPLYLHTGFKNDYRDVYNNLQADISNNFKNTINIDEDGYSNKCLVYAKAGIVFNNLVIEVQLEENTIATDIVIPESEEHSLRIGNLELNGIGAIRDSLVIELADENISDKKIKKIYLNKKNYKYVFTGTENIIIPATPVSEGVKCYKIVLPKVFSNNYVKADCNRCSFLTDSGEWLNASDKTDIAVLSVAAEGPSMYWRVPEGEIPDVTSMSNYLKNNETYITYPLKNPELIDITDDNIELVKDVEYLINNFKTFKEVTHVEVENGYIDLEYVKSTELALKNIQQQIDNISALMLEGGTGNA